MTVVVKVIFLMFACLQLAAALLFVAGALQGTHRSLADTIGFSAIAGCSLLFLVGCFFILGKN